MEIPNYDSGDNPDKKYKQLFHYMPSDTFRMLICGNSGSGKTNLLYHMLIKVARYSFLRPIPPKFEHKLRRHRQSFGKIATTVVLDKDENLL